MYKNYINTIKKQLNLQPEQWYFKNDHNYTGILEHVSEEQGNQFLNIIQIKYKNFYDSNLEFLKQLCDLNDKNGKTQKYQFKNFMTCSPSNLRYILHSLLILDDVKKYKLNDIDIIEIGGGYGGLCLFILNIAPLFDLRINSYSIFDLLEASQLQKIYLDALNIKNVNFYQLDNFNNLKDNSFLISNYAFSEISNELQVQYIKKIINPYTKFGFLTWNFIPFYDFVENSIIEKELEYPQTIPTHIQIPFNYYVRFYPKYE